MFNPFSIVTSKIFGGVAIAAIAFGVVQTARIEGVYCRDVATGEKPRCIVQGFKQDVAAIRIDLVAARRRTEDEIASHRATKQAYADAQKTAEQLELTRLARVTAQQKEANHDIVQDYERRVAAARAAAERLRRQAGSTGAPSAGARGNVALSGLSDAASGADGATGNRGLSLDQRLTATNQASQLQALQEWNRRQAAIDPN